MAATVSLLVTNSSLNNSNVEYEDCYYDRYNDTNASSTTNGTGRGPSFDQRMLHTISVILYAIICVVGLIGNGLVIYVILRYAKMKTVTNIYILNLAISDVMFLFSLPFLITTTLIEYWVFGFALCKIFLVLYSINFFTSVFTLTVLSADRYMAVCHPVRSVKYRTSKISFFICLIVWCISFWVMLPIILYSTTVPSNKYHGKDSCTIKWPEGQPIPADKAFTWYTFLLGFAIPVSLISVFYLSVILRLKTVGPAKKSKERKKSNRKVTIMVLTVIAVYVICWLPYWCFQVNLTFKKEALQEWEVSLFHGFTVLTFVNSMMNPFLYAFLSDNFRKSFMKAFRCASVYDVNKSLAVENSTFPKQSNTKSVILNTQIDDQCDVNLMPCTSYNEHNYTRKAEQSETLLASNKVTQHNDTVKVDKDMLE